MQLRCCVVTGNDGKVRPGGRVRLGGRGLVRRGWGCVKEGEGREGEREGECLMG